MRAVATAASTTNPGWTHRRRRTGGTGGGIEGGGHLHLAVDALLAQDGDARGGGVDVGGDVGDWHRIGEMEIQPRIVCRQDAGKLLVGAGRVVA